MEVPTQEAIDKAFIGTSFGQRGETADGRKKIVATAVLQRACGFSCGGTITAICKELGLLTKSGNPRLHAKHWAFCVLHTNGGY